MKLFFFMVFVALITLTVLTVKEKKPDNSFTDGKSYIIERDDFQEAFCARIRYKLFKEKD